MEKFKNILITGGAGFIGSNLVRNIIKRGSSNVYVLDKLGYASDSSSVSSLLRRQDINFSRNYQLFKGDISNKEIVEDVIKQVKPDLIINLAAESHVDRSINNPEQFISSNVVGTYQMLNSSFKYFNSLTREKQNIFKFIHVSTDEVFGSLGHEGYFNEESKYDPRSPYSASKASSDHLVNAWLHTYGLPTIITNCSNNFGPWQFPEKLIPNSVSKALSNQEIPLYGSGNNIRDWLYVEDHVEALLLVAFKGIPGKKYCIGSNNEKTNKEIIEMICDFLDELSPKQYSYKSLIRFVNDRPGHDFRYAIDSSLIRKELGWCPKYEFEESLYNTVKWYFDNQSWVNKKNNCI